MYSYTRRGPGRGAALLAVLQAILLLSAVVLTPAAVIAQEADPGASQTPAAETTGQPAAEPTAELVPQAEPKTEPRAEVKADPKPRIVGQPKAAPEPKPTAAPAAEKTLAEQGWTIRLWPPKVKVAVGGKVIVGAYKCRANDKTPFGGAKGSGDPTDYCDPIRVKWTTTDGARLSNTFGKKTRLTLISDDAPVRLTATVDDLKRPTRVIVKEKAAKVRPDGLTPAQLQQLRQSTAETPVVETPTVETPVVETPTVETPKADPADDCLVDPVSGECLVEDPTEAPAEEPTAAPTEPTEAPAEEPTAAPAEPTEAPAECLIDPVTGDCLAEVPGGVDAPEEPVIEAPAPTPDEPKAPQPKATKEPNISGTSSIRAPAARGLSVAGIASDIEGRMSDGSGSNCIRYDPQDGNASQTEWVPFTSGSQTFDIAWLAHGRTNSSCPAELTILGGNNQSAVGFSPSTVNDINPGEDFLLGLMWHANNPIVGANQFFNGDMDVRLTIGGQVVDYSFPWTLNETPNNASPSTNPANNDILTFSDTTGNTPIVIDGITYNLILKGFTDNGTGTIGSTPNACPLTAGRHAQLPVHHRRDAADDRVPVRGARTAPSADHPEARRW